MNEVNDNVDKSIPVTDNDISKIIDLINGEKYDYDETNLLPLSDEFIEELTTNLSLIMIDELSYNNQLKYNKLFKKYQLLNIKKYMDLGLLINSGVISTIILTNTLENNIDLLDLFVMISVAPTVEKIYQLLNKTNNKKLKIKLVFLLVLEIELVIMYIFVNYYLKGDINFIKPGLIYPLIKIPITQLQNDIQLNDDLNYDLDCLETEMIDLEFKEEEKLLKLKNHEIYFSVTGRQD